MSDIGHKPESGRAEDGKSIKGEATPTQTLDADMKDMKPVVGHEELDEAATYLAGHEEFGPLTPEKEKALVRKIDAWMLPLVRGYAYPCFEWQLYR